MSAVLKFPATAPGSSVPGAGAKPRALQPPPEEAATETPPAPVPPLTAPKAVKTTVKTHGRVTVTWTAVPGADRYLVERREGSRRFAHVREVTEPVYIDKNAFFGTTFHYRIRAARKDGSTSRYSAIMKARALDRPSQFRNMWQQTFVAEDRKAQPKSDDPDTLCEAAALKAAWDLSSRSLNDGGLPEACGRKWNTPADLVIEGYIACKEALPRYVPNKGALSGYLYKTAKGRILNAAHEQFMSSGKRDHGHDTPLPIVTSREAIIARCTEMRESEDDGYVPAFLSNAERAPAQAAANAAQAAVDLQIALEQLPEDERNILWLRHIAGLTLTAIAKTLGMSYTTLQRRAEALDAKYGLSSRGVDRISKK